MRSARLLSLVAVFSIAALGAAGGQHPGPDERTEPRTHFDAHLAVSYDVLALTVRQELQSRLAQRGFYDGPIDGRVGQATLEAVAHFQWSQGLEATGYLDAPTSRSLGMEIFVEPPPAQPMLDRRPPSAPPPAPPDEPASH
jgi:peptidoglycan hydrolase-like protein with peptidoglycan-binding domain